MKTFHLLLLLLCALLSSALPTLKSGVIAPAKKGIVGRSQPLAPRNTYVAPLRGGEVPLVSATTFLKLSSAWCLIEALAMFLDYKWTCRYLWFMKSEPAIADLPREMFASLFFGLSVAKQGELAGKYFCKLYTLPLAVLTGVLLCPRHKVPSPTIICSVLWLLASAYFGFA